VPSPLEPAGVGPLASCGAMENAPWVRREGAAAIGLDRPGGLVGGTGADDPQLIALNSAKKKGRKMAGFLEESPGKPDESMG